MSGDYNKIKLRVKTVEEAVQLLTQIALRADERIDGVDERMGDFDASLNNLTVKVEALVDAQIRIEGILSAKVEALAVAQIRSEEILTSKVEALAAAQIRTEETLSAKFEALAAAQLRTEESLTILAKAQVNLAETQAHTDKRLDALINIVREDREGRDGK
jgi:hypothetical protein